MSEHHKFRYLLPPGSNFAFVRKFKIWLVGSVFLMAAAIGTLFVNKAVRGDYMNWTIDFKGGTEIIFAFKDKTSGKFVTVDPAKVRSTFEKAKEHGVELSDISYTEQTTAGEETVRGMIVRSPRFSALTPAQQQKATADFLAKFGDREIGKATWSGDRMFVRSKKAIKNEEAVELFKANGLELKPWDAKQADQYANPDNWRAHYEGTGAEILEQLGAPPDAFVAGVGTGGTLTGAGRALREANPRLHIAAAIPEAFPGIEGLKPLGQPGDIVPPILDESLIDERLAVTLDEALAMCRRLAGQGLFVGPSSGAFVHGALMLAAHGGFRCIVTVLSDTGERYGSTGMWRA